MRVHALTDKMMERIRPKKKAKAKFFFFWRRYKTPDALPLRGFNDDPTEYTWEDWRYDTKREFPVQYFLRSTLPHHFKVRITMNISHMWYWFRCHTYNRYHMLDLRNKTMDYKWGYSDVVGQMMYACFNLLVKYVEKEKPFEYINWDDTDESVAAAKEIRDLYQWWISGREKEHSDCTALYSTLPKKGIKGLLGDGADTRSEEYGKWAKEFDRLEKKDQEQLVRLVAIREVLWT